MAKSIKLITLAIIIALIWAPFGWAAEQAKPRELVKQATGIIQKMLSGSGDTIPPSLLKKSAGVVIFPSVIKGGLIIGGTYGRGVILAKNDTQTWSPPAFVDFGGGSFGFQIGVQSTDLVLVVKSKIGLTSLLKTNFKIGGDIGVAAGPVGRKAEASTDLAFKAEILSYSSTKGLFAGFSLEGSGIGPMYDYDKSFYGKSYTTDEIIFDRKAIPPAEAKQLMDELGKYTKK